MIQTIEILYNVTGQTLYLDCPEGRPSSVTSVSVWEDSQADTGATESAVGAASIESVTTTVDAASGYSQADPTKVNLAATTSIVVGRSYLITNAYGEKETVVVERIDSGNAVYSRTPLKHDYASADTFVSTRISATVDPTWVADSGNVSDPLCPRPRYRHVWTYVVGGVTCRTAGFFDLVRYKFVTTVTPADVDRLARGWLSRLAIDDQRGAGETVISEAVQQVKLDLWERDLTAYAQRSSEVVTELIRRKAVAIVSEQAYRHGGVSQAVAEADDAAYWRRVENLVTSARSHQQITADGAAGTVDARPFTRR